MGPVEPQPGSAASGRVGSHCPAPKLPAKTPDLFLSGGGRIGPTVFQGGRGYAVHLSDVARVAIMVATVPMKAGQSVTGQPQVTFTKDVAPILQEHCQACHRAGTIAPMSLVTYEEARPWARSIKQKVVAREMPPWFIDKNVGVQHFSNDRIADRRRNRDDRQVGGQRRSAGKSRRHAARRAQFPDADAWQIGKPDLIVTLPKDLIVKAKAPDQWPDILVDPHLTEDRYVQGVQIIPTKGYHGHPPHPNVDRRAH